MTTTWTLSYQQDGNRTYWQIKSIDADMLGHYPTKFCSNNYCSFTGWNFEKQRHGWASSPSGLDARKARQYFLGELRSMAANIFGDETFDRERWPKFSVRKVTDLV